MAERVNGILKQEYWLDENFSDSYRARQACIEAIRLYNTRRPHRQLAMRTPEQMHEASLQGRFSPQPPLRNARRLGPFAHDGSRE